jgi:hypothetical protein
MVTAACTRSGSSRCQRTDPVAHALLRSIEQLRDAGGERGVAVARNERVHALGRLATGAHHGAEVALALARAAHVGEEHVQHGLVRAAAVVDPDGRDAHALLVDLAHPAGEAARAHAAHVAPVRPHHREEEELPVDE